MDNRKIPTKICKRWEKRIRWNRHKMGFNKIEIISINYILLLHVHTHTHTPACTTQIDSILESTWNFISMLYGVFVAAGYIAE